MVIEQRSGTLQRDRWVTAVCGRHRIPGGDVAGYIEDVDTSTSRVHLALETQVFASAAAHDSLSPTLFQLIEMLCLQSSRLCAASESFQAVS